MLKKIEQESWSYTLYSGDGKYILSVLCGTSAMYEITFELDSNEIRKVESGDVKDLVRLVRDKPNLYKSRIIKNFQHL